MKDLRNIVLVGFMGSGKSRVGQILARRLGRRFLDMDHEIVEREGRPIPEIFAASGEPYFRSLEKGLAQELGRRANLVIACGGGIVLQPENLQALGGEHGFVVCLKASPETILERVGEDKNRPLLAGEDRMERIRTLLAGRAPLYDAIPLFVDTNGRTPAQVADEVIRVITAQSGR